MMLMMIALPFVVDSDLKKNIIYVQFSGLLADFLITIFISLTTDLCQDIIRVLSLKEKEHLLGRMKILFLQGNVPLK